MPAAPAPRPIPTAAAACGPAPAPAPVDESIRLAALRDLRILDTLPDERFDRITRIAAARFAMPIARITFVDDDRTWFKSRIGMTATEAPRQTSICAHAILEPKTLVVPDLAADPRFQNSPFVVGGPKLRFYAGAPITLDGGLRVGSVCIMDIVSHPEFSDDDAAFLADLAEIVVHELDLHRQIVERDAKLEASDAALHIARGAKRRFMTIVSHELRTPLNAICGFNQLIADEAHGPLGDPRYADYARHAAEAAERLEALVERIISYASAEAAEVRLCEEEIPVTSFLTSCAAAVGADAEARGVTLATRVAPGAPDRLYVDAVQAGEIMIQLARNAIAHSPDGGCVTLEAAARDDDGALLCVLDRGPGVDPNALDQVM